MISMWFTGINYYKLAVLEKDRDSIFTIIWKQDLIKWVKIFIERNTSETNLVYNPD